MSEQKINALVAFCHAQRLEDGTVDPNQPYMGVVCITVFRGKKLENVNIKANVIIELRVKQPEISYPVRILRLRNGSLKEFNSGKVLFTPFQSSGDLQYADHFGAGFSEFINASFIEAMLNKIEGDDKKAFYRVMFTIDTEGKAHKLHYKQLSQELSEKAENFINNVEPGETDVVSSEEVAAVNEN